MQRFVTEIYLVCGYCPLRHIAMRSYGLLIFILYALHHDTKVHIHIIKKSILQ